MSILWQQYPGNGTIKKHILLGAPKDLRQCQNGVRSLIVSSKLNNKHICINKEQIVYHRIKYELSKDSVAVARLNRALPLYTLTKIIYIFFSKSVTSRPLTWVGMLWYNTSAKYLTSGQV